MGTKAGTRRRLKPTVTHRMTAGRLEYLRYGLCAERDELVEACVDEFRRFFRAGRVQWDIRRDALDIVLWETLDEMAVDCPSWSETPYHEVRRGRNDE